MQTQNQKTQRFGTSKNSAVMPEVRDNQCMYFKRI